jgi:hypothetical protein
MREKVPEKARNSSATHTMNIQRPAIAVIPSVNIRHVNRQHSIIMATCK